MKSVPASKTVVALLLSAAMVALIPTSAAAQKKATMPSTQYNPNAWMIQMNNIGNHQVNQMYSRCIHNPGACNGLATFRRKNAVSETLPVVYDQK